MEATVLRQVFSCGRISPSPKCVHVSGAGTRIGRHEGYGVSVPEDSRVSRHHATVTRDALGRLTVVDEGSRNGTFVNGARVERRLLARGDVVSAGDTCLVVAEDPDASRDAVIEGLAGDSAGIRRVRSELRSIAPTPQTVLVVAESGCGKEVVARAVHTWSGLTGELVAVNCAAIPENLFESQLFGHVAGAFTGASPQQGYFRAAHGGTLFLDEIGELPLALQPKLLRAIQERAVVPLGTTKPVPCAVRIVAATNRDLAKDAAEGRFRQDLFARLFESLVTIPPLRDRREDVLLLFARGFGEGLPPVPHDLAEALLLHPWPYNVREVLAAASDLRARAATSGQLQADWFRRRVDFGLARRDPADEAAPPKASSDKDELVRLLTEKGGVVSEVARAVGRSRRQVHRWIAQHGLDPDAFRR